MSLTVAFEQLLDYSDHERSKWRGWIAADPGRLEVTVQRGGRFPTIGTLLDHVFLIERRHLSRLEGGTPPDATGVAAGDWARLFDYADLVRADLRRYAAEIDDAVGSSTIAFSVAGESYAMSRRRLMVHILLHEIRHLAQIALAARTAGVEPPGKHDLAFYADFT